MERFNGVYIQDSSIVTLPDELGELFQGCGGSSPQNTSSSVKMQVRWDLKAGSITGPYLQAGRVNDKNSPLQHESLPKGAMRMADLGYFSLNELAELDRDGVYWLTKVKSPSVVYVEDERSSLVSFLLAQRLSNIDQPLLLVDDCKKAFEDASHLFLRVYAFVQKQMGTGF